MSFMQFVMAIDRTGGWGALDPCGYRRSWMVKIQWRPKQKGWKWWKLYWFVSNWFSDLWASCCFVLVASQVWRSTPNCLLGVRNFQCGGRLMIALLEVVSEPAATRPPLSLRASTFSQECQGIQAVWSSFGRSSRMKRTKWLTRTVMEGGNHEIHDSTR